MSKVKTVDEKIAENNQVLLAAMQQMLLKNAANNHPSAVQEEPKKTAVVIPATVQVQTLPSLDEVARLGQVAQAAIDAYLKAAYDANAPTDKFVTVAVLDVPARSDRHISFFGGKVSQITHEGYKQWQETKKANPSAKPGRRTV